MAKKSLGFVELEWTCPTCNTHNPGTERTCQGCGAPMPPDVAFEAPSQTAILSRDEVGEAATEAPDIHCPYCDARNPADAKVCKQCGGDLSGGEARSAGGLVEGFSTAAKAPIVCSACGQENPPGNRTCANCGAPLPTARPAAKPAPPRPKPQPSTKGMRGCFVAFAVVALIAVVGFGWVIMRGAQRTSTVGRVVETEWTRTIQIEGLLPRQYTAWREDVPGDAVIGQCTDAVRETVAEPVAGAREVCGTPYAIDQGTGLGEVVQDCEYQILAQRCEYTVKEWQAVREAVTTGSGFAPLWPADALVEGERPGARSEAFVCVFSADDTIYRYRVASFDEYQLCTPGSTWNLEVSGNGRVVAAVPAD